MPDGALQGHEVFIETPQHFQNRFLVLQKNIAPHNRVGRGNTGKIAEAAGGIFNDGTARIAFQLGGGAHNIERNQMGQMAGNRQHKIMVAGIHKFDLAANIAPQARHGFNRVQIRLARRG